MPANLIADLSVRGRHRGACVGAMLSQQFLPPRLSLRENYSTRTRQAETYQEVAAKMSGDKGIVLF